MNWLSLDQYTGSLGYNEVDILTITYNSSGLSPGIYNAEIVISNNAGDDIIIAVEMEVVHDVLQKPIIIETIISNDGSNFSFSWDPVPGATSYKVYSSTDPYATFPDQWQLEYQGVDREWNEPFSEQRKYFLVTAVN